MADLICEEVIPLTAVSKTGNLQPEFSKIREKLAELPENFGEFQSDSQLPPVKAVRDSNLLKDDRVLKNMLKNQIQCVPELSDYLREIQPDLTPGMRKTVTDWMLQVCLHYLSAVCYVNKV